MMKFLSLCLICVAAIMVDAQCYRGEGTVEEVSVKTSGQCNDDIGEDTCKYWAGKNILWQEKIPGVSYDAKYGGAITNYDRPPCCYYDKTLHQYIYNQAPVYGRSDAKNQCSDDKPCVCVGQSQNCVKCPKNMYSPGTSSGLTGCQRCPTVENGGTELPYTCIGKDCNGTGAESIASCQAEPITCEPGTGLQGDSIAVRSIGPCDRVITTIEECKEVYEMRKPSHYPNIPQWEGLACNGEQIREYATCDPRGYDKFAPKGCFMHIYSNGNKDQPTFVTYGFNEIPADDTIIVSKCNDLNQCVCKPKTCEPCPANTYSKGGLVPCTACPLFYSSLPGSTQCMDIGTIALMNTLKDTCSASSNGNGRRLNVLCGGSTTNGDEASKVKSETVVIIVVVTVMLAALLFCCGIGYLVYGRKYIKNNNSTKRTNLQNRNTWDMNAIELQQRNKLKETDNKVTLEIKSNANQTTKNVHLNPLRTSAVGFVIEDVLPVINKKSKPNRKSIISADDNNTNLANSNGEWVEYIDENSGKAYYHNEKLGVTQWEPPANVLFEKVT